MIMTINQQALPQSALRNNLHAQITVNGQAHKIKEYSYGLQKFLAQLVGLPE